MMKIRLLSFSLLLCFAGILLAECAITDITVHQRWPWNGLVDITYNVVCDETDASGNPLKLDLEFSGYDAFRNVDIPMTTLSGDGVNASVASGGPYITTWNAGIDSPDFATEYFRVNIKAFASSGEAATVSSVEIVGKSSLGSSDIETYSLKVIWSDGRQTTVTPEWSITRGNEYASVDNATGEVTVKNTTGTDQTVELKATCVIDGDTWTKTLSLTVVGPNAYLVVNLADGSYSYTADVPDLSKDDCRTTELWLRKIPFGTFTMGSPSDEIGRYTNEDLHQVTLTQDYYIGVFEITQSQWELLMGSNPSFCNAEDNYATRPVECVSYDMIRGTRSAAGAGWPSRGHSVDATSFMGKLQSLTGLTFDLPTEAQWEYACRGGKASALNSGKDLVSGGEDANMAEVGRYWNNGGSGYSMDCTPDFGTAVVGSFLPNAFGLYDMHGNVWEWCLDWYNEKLGTSETTDPVGASSGLYRLIRGGGWQIEALECRAAHRGYNLPNCNGFYGLRVVCLDLPN